MKKTMKGLPKFTLACFLTLASSGTLANPTASQTTNRSSPVSVGEIAPDFTLLDQFKKKTTLSDVSHTSSVVLVFYRGYW